MRIRETATLLTCGFWRHALQQPSAVVMIVPDRLPESSTTMSPCGDLKVSAGNPHFHSSAQGTKDAG